MDPESGRIYYNPTELDKMQKSLVSVSEQVADLMSAGNETRMAELTQQVTQLGKAQTESLAHTLKEPLEATCVQCGCTDSMACPEGCSWIWVNRSTGRGRCTSCRP